MMTTPVPSTPDTIAVLAFPDQPPAERPGSSPGTLEKLARIARYKRNARSPEYMRTLAASALPHATMIEVARAVPPARIATARHVVLLWPDAIGSGWGPIERAVFRAKAAGTPVYALTGRRRSLQLTTGTLFAFRLRRLVERLWLGEVVFAAGLLLSAPFLVIWDFARGRR